MYAIEVVKLSDQDSKLIFAVTVAKGDNDYDFQVTLPFAYYQKLSGGKILAEELIKKIFLFLLDRESPQEILTAFDVTQIKFYFPSFETEISGY